VVGEGSVGRYISNENHLAAVLGQVYVFSAPELLGAVLVDSVVVSLAQAGTARDPLYFCGRRRRHSSKYHCC